jgi:hypothetical protein
MTHHAEHLQTSWIRSKWAKGIGAAVAMGVVAFVVSYASGTLRRWEQEAKLGLTGQTRANFIESGLRTCVATQRNHPDNRDTPVATIIKFCRCYMGEMADRLSLNDLKPGIGLTDDTLAAWQESSAGKAYQSAMQPKYEAAQDACERQQQ